MHVSIQEDLQIATLRLDTRSCLRVHNSAELSAYSYLSRQHSTTMSFNTDQLGMAIFLLIAVIFNIWFVATSARRAFKSHINTDGGSVHDSLKYKLVTYSVLAMACFDIPWVWLCMIQCWNNTIQSNSFNQNSGDDSLGCQFMGWYSSFSLVSMMGSHCLVANYLKNWYRPNRKGCAESKAWFLGLCLVIVLAACLFASVPLIQGDGYKLTTGGFCYSDFTNNVQSSLILTTVMLLLLIAGYLWIQVGRWSHYWYFVVVFFATWLLWIPATSYGIATGEEIPSPYMIVGAIVGHGNAIVNPSLYGVQLFRLMNSTEETVKTDRKELLEDAEDPKIEISSSSNQPVTG
jgi:hypothetical protein